MRPSFVVAGSAVSVLFMFIASGCAGLVGADFDGYTLARDAGTSPLEGSGDASAVPTPEAPAPEAPASDGTCADGWKLCEGLCVSVLDPSYGCGADTCEACSLPHARAACTRDGVCVRIARSDDIGVRWRHLHRRKFASDHQIQPDLRCCAPTRSGRGPAGRDVSAPAVDVSGAPRSSAGAP